MKSSAKATKPIHTGIGTILFVLLVLAGTNIQVAYAAQGITLDHVSSTTSSTSVSVDKPVRFTFRLTNTPGTGACITGFTNGFRVYEKNGGSFVPISYDTLSVTPDWTTICDGGFFINAFGVDGAGEDTVGFGGFRITGPGICDPFDQQVWYIETGSSNIGDTLCVDSSFWPPGGIWTWATTSGTITPSWDGPHCFHVSPPFGPANDTTESRGRFGLQVNPNFAALFSGYPGYNAGSGILTSPQLYDPQTIIGHSDYLYDGDPEDSTGVPVGIPSVDIGDPDFVLTPLGFEGPPGTREIHTEVRSLYMDDGDPVNGTYVRAGIEASTRPFSPGEVEMHSGEFLPGESFFDVYVELQVPDVGATWGCHINAANEVTDPLLIRADTIYSLPPVVTYVHDTSNVVPVYFTNSCSTSTPPWVSGQILGYIVLAGHGVGIDSSMFEEDWDSIPQGTCCEERGNVDGLTDQGSAVNISDLSYLVDYLFNGGSAPPCSEMANVDGIPGIDVADLTYLVDYLFRSGPPPPTEGC